MVLLDFFHNTSVNYELVNCSQYCRYRKNVIEYFNQLRDSIQQVYVHDCGEVLDYFENHYIDRFWRNAPRRPLLFSLDFSNMFQWMQHKLSRTNNNVEG